MDRDHEASQEDVGALRIAAGTSMERIVHFESCAHEKSMTMPASAYLGYTRSELAAHFPEASIITFAPGSVKLMQVNAGYCPQHYILRLNDEGSLTVLHTNDTFLTEELMTVICGEPEQYPPNETEPLRAGIAFDSLAEIDAYLESIMS